MKSFRIAKAGRARAARRRGTAVGMMATAIMVGMCALPMPALLGKFPLMRSIAIAEERQEYLKTTEKKIVALESKLPGLLRKTISDAADAFPRIDNALTLRNLLLAQAAACNVEIQSCTYSVPEFTGIAVPCIDECTGVARTEMELLGSAPFQNLLLLLHFLESTRNVYTLNAMELASDSSEYGCISYRLDLNVFFRGELSDMEGAYDDEEDSENAHDGVDP